ncbi:flagellin [Candidatus Kuenenia sp.]|uniref:flagellin n=1 Tax=Candidatus Kuenenia sp. TaxID=2499824 RepID=UPI0032201EEA
MRNNYRAKYTLISSEICFYQEFLLLYVLIATLVVEILMHACVFGMYFDYCLLILFGYRYRTCMGLSTNMTRVGANIKALNALSSINDKMAIAHRKLATGKRINSVADDAASWSIVTKLIVCSKGLGQALNNVGSAKQMISVAEGHLNNVLEILTRMKTKAIMGADDSLATEERNAIDAELLMLGRQIDLETAQASWNSTSIFDGNSTTGDSNNLFKLQIGAGSNATDDLLKFDILNNSNVALSSNNTGFSTSKLSLTASASGIASIGGINVTRSFAAAGFTNTPDGTVTINGETFTLSNYNTVQEFMDDVNNDGIDLTKSFDKAGFKTVPDGTLTVNGDTFTLSDYSTVQAFMDDINATVTDAEISYNSGTDTFRFKKVGGAPGPVLLQTGTNGFLTVVNIPPGGPYGGAGVTSSSNVGHDTNANISYDRSTDTFTIQKTSGSNLIVSETGAHGFLTEAKITPGTYGTSATSSSAVGGIITIDLSQDFTNAGFPNTPDGTVTVNGATFTLSNYSTVQAFLNAINNDTNADASISYNSTNSTFSIKGETIGKDLVIAETGTNGFFTQANITTGTYSATGVSSSSVARDFINKVDTAIADVSKALSYIGVSINRLTYQENSLMVSRISTEAARSRIEDANMAEEQLVNTKLQILQKTATSMVAPSNVSNQWVLSLFK